MCLQPKRRRTGNGVKVEEAAAVPPAAKVEAVLATETGAGDMASETVWVATQAHVEHD